MTTRFVGPINLTKKAGKKAQTQFTLTLPTTVPPWYNRAAEGDAALAYKVAHIKGFKFLTIDELSALTVEKLRKRLQAMTKSEGNKETGVKMLKDALVQRLYHLQQDPNAADSAAAETQAVIANEASLANPPFSAVVRSNFVTKEFQSVVVTSSTHGIHSAHSSSGPQLTVHYENLFASPPEAAQSGPSNLQLRWCIEGVLPNIACYGSVVAGAGRVAEMTGASADVVARDQAATRSLQEAALALAGGPLAAEAGALAEKAACSERAVEEVVGLLYSEPSDSPPNEVHVTVLVDFSGSMSGIRIRNAIKSLRAILTSLDHESTFSVFKFGSTCVGIPISENVVIQATQSNIENMMSQVRPDANMGGTDLIGAVRTVLDVGTHTFRRNNILIITDGEVGSQEANTVKSLLSVACPCSALAGIIGVGNDVTRATLQAVVEGGCGPQAIVFDRDSEETIAENIIGAVGALLATDFRDVRWPSEPIVCTSRRIVVNEQAVSASWALYSGNCARSSEVVVARILEQEVAIPDPRVPKIWTQSELQALTVDKLRKMLRSQLKNDFSSEGLRRKEDFVNRLLERQSELVVSNAEAAQSAADARAQAVAAQDKRSRPVSVPYFAVTHAETVRNMCIAAALARTRNMLCPLSEAKQFALRYGFVGPDSDTVMVAISNSATGAPCKATVAVGMPGAARHENSDESNLNGAVWGYGSSGSSPLPPSYSRSPSSSYKKTPKPAPKCIFKPRAFAKGIAKAKSSAPAKKCASMKSAYSAAPKKCAPAKAAKKCAPAKSAKKCAAKKSSTFSPYVSFSAPPSRKIAAKVTAPTKRPRDSVSLLDILGALNGGSWRMADPTVKSFIQNYCKTASALASDAAATIAIIAILRSKFSAFKKGWHVHVNRSKAFARKSVGEAMYASLKHNFKASLL